MHARVDKPAVSSRLMVKYDRIAKLITAALRQPDEVTNKAHRRVLQLVRSGIYERFDGKRFYVVGIRRASVRLENRTYYCVDVLPLGWGTHGIESWELLCWADPEKAWFYPATVGGMHVRRFIPIHKITLTGIVQRARL